MKPTPTQIDAAARSLWDRLSPDFTFDEARRLNHSQYVWVIGDAEAALSAALSVPAAAVVGEPEGWKLVPIVPTHEILMALSDNRYDVEPGGKANWTFEWNAILAAAPSAPDGWQPIETAPHACHVIACYFYECEWIYDVVLSPPSPPFTHWKMLPAPPAGEKP